MRIGLKMALTYRKSALQEMMAHAHDVLGHMDDDDQDRGKWNTFYCGCEDMLQLMAKAEMFEDALRMTEEIRTRRGLEDWTIAAQAAAMATGVSEVELLAACREIYQ